MKKSKLLLYLCILTIICQYAVASTNNHSKMLNNANSYYSFDLLIMQQNAYDIFQNKLLGYGLTLGFSPLLEHNNPFLKPLRIAGNIKKLRTNNEYVSPSISMNDLTLDSYKVDNATTININFYYDFTKLFIPNSEFTAYLGTGFGKSYLEYQILDATIDNQIINQTTLKNKNLPTILFATGINYTPHYHNKNATKISRISLNLEYQHLYYKNEKDYFDYVNNQLGDYLYNHHTNPAITADVLIISIQYRFE